MTRKIINMLGLIGFSALPMIHGKAVYEDAPDAASTNNTELVKWSEKLTAIGRDELSYFRTNATVADSGKRLTYTDSPASWSSRVLYQVMPDRYNNGDATNDAANLPTRAVNQAAAEPKVEDLVKLADMRHGGDIKGIMDRLPYLKSIGVGTVHVTSVLMNSGGEYHGYCVTNPLQVDPGFGTLQDLQKLVAAAHKLGIMVLMDFVPNHLCQSYTGTTPPAMYYSQEPTIGEVDACVTALNEYDVYGIPIPKDTPRATISNIENVFSPFAKQDFFSRCGSVTSNVAGWEKYIDISPEMLDLDTNNQVVIEMMTNFAKYWIAATDIDGINLDAVRYTTDKYVAYLSTHVRDFAASLGKKNFLVIGEYNDVSSSGIASQAGSMFGSEQNVNTAKMVAELEPTFSAHPVSKFPGLVPFDFGKYGAVHASFLGGFREQNGEFLGSNNMPLVSELFGNPRSAVLRNQVGLDTADLGSFISSHDTVRFMRSLKKYAGSDDDLRTEGFISAQVINFFTHGTPMLYYGDDLGLTSDCVIPGSFTDGKGKHPLHDDVVVFTSTDNATEATEFFTSPDSSLSFCNNNQVDQGQFYSTSQARQTAWVGAGFNLDVINPQDHVEITRAARLELPSMTQNALSGKKNDPFAPMMNGTNAITKAIREISELRGSCASLQSGSQSPLPQLFPLFGFKRVAGNEEGIVIVNSGLTDVTVSTKIGLDVSVEAGTMFVNPFDKSVKFPVVDNGEDGPMLDLNGTQISAMSRMVLFHESQLKGTPTYVSLSCGVEVLPEEPSVVALGLSLGAVGAILLTAIYAAMFAKKDTSMGDSELGAVTDAHDSDMKSDNPEFTV